MTLTLRALAAAGALTLLAACGDAAESPPDPNAAQGSDEFTACMVADSGGIDDRSFNASAWAGLQHAESELGVAAEFVESDADADYAPNIAGLVEDDCSLIVTVGFLMRDATVQAATANADERFALVDAAPAEALDNVRPLLFDTAQAAFLGGYLAAGMSRSGTVATLGGQAIPPVTLFMDGFVDGVDYYNRHKGTAVKVLGWDKAAQQGSLVGNFEDQAAGERLAQDLIGQGADILLPVAGQAGLGAAAAAAATAGEVRLIWAQTDGYESAPQYQSLFLTSIIKRVDTATMDTVQAAMAGDFTNEPFVGTLANTGVALAPYHDVEDDVPPDLKGEVDALKQAIIDGDVVVDSVSSPASG